MIVAGNKIYERCGDCGHLVQVNKTLVGSLHICLPPEEREAQRLGIQLIPTSPEEFVKTHQGQMMLSGLLAAIAPKVPK